jgi:hypothetical protein
MPVSKQIGDSPAVYTNMLTALDLISYTLSAIHTATNPPFLVVLARIREMIAPYISLFAPTNDRKGGPEVNQPSASQRVIFT